jgi:predicted TPR repeat methyltransferase
MSSKLKLRPMKRRRSPSAASLGGRLASAIQIHQKGQVQEAADLYRLILADSPDHADALHFLGVAEHQLGNSESALEHIGRALDRVPDHPDALNNRGNILKKLGRLDEAEADYRRALQLRPQDPNALNNLGTILRQRGDLADAEATFKKVLALDPRHPGAWPNLGNLLRKLGRMDEAIEVYRRWLAVFPDDPRAKHMLASSTGESIPARATDGYVRAEFDEFADAFDTTLAQLEYRAPGLVEDEVTRLFGAPQPRLAVLDAGCGTGLCGPHLRPRSNFLVGVDLSPAMVELARKRCLYDALVVEELTAYLRRHEGTCDLIVSADTLVYFGELADVTTAAAKTLRPGGALVFTVEHAQPQDAPDGYRIHPHGRYSHTHDYILRTLAQAGFADPSLRTVQLRKEADTWVEGWLVSARVPAAELRRTEP